MASDEHSTDKAELVVGPEEAGHRLDVFLAAHFPDFSRAQLRKAIDADGVTVDGERAKVAYRLRLGQKIEVALPEQPRTGPQPENIPIEVLYEDACLAAINKPPGMVVHPAKGHWSGTLASALAFHFQNLSTVGGPTRPGIVHRLDRDTSGVIVVAKTDQAHLRLARQFERRTTQKEYQAIVLRAPDRDRDVIDMPIGPHPISREKMAIRRDHASSRAARTFYEVERRFDGYALLRVVPQTGRTHQIRVHLAHVGCPVLCDRLYGGKAVLKLGELAGTDDQTVWLDRQALHAHRLVLAHPMTGEPLELTAPLPPDMTAVLQALEQYRPKRL